MEHFNGSHSFLLVSGEMDGFVTYELERGLDFSQPRPAETAPGMPIFTSLSVLSSWPSCQFILPSG